MTWEASAYSVLYLTERVLVKHVLLPGWQITWDANQACHPSEPHRTTPSRMLPYPDARRPIQSHETCPLQRHPPNGMSTYNSGSHYFNAGANHLAAQKGRRVVLNGRIDHFFTNSTLIFFMTCQTHCSEKTTDFQDDTDQPSTNVTLICYGQIPTQLILTYYWRF